MARGTHRPAHGSHIERDQLGTHSGSSSPSASFSSYAIAKATRQAGFVLTFRPGPSFFQDYDRFYRRRNQGELQWDFRADDRDIAEPFKVAHLFTEKRTGRPEESVAYVNSKDVETASTSRPDQIPGGGDVPRLRARPRPRRPSSTCKPWGPPPVPSRPQGQARDPNGAKASKPRSNIAKTNKSPMTHSAGSKSCRVRRRFPQPNARTYSADPPDRRAFGGSWPISFSPPKTHRSPLSATVTGSQPSNPG